MSDGPGSDDPEADLERLIGRTVPRSPHAAHPPASDGPEPRPSAEPDPPAGPVPTDVADDLPSAQAEQDLRDPEKPCEDTGNDDWDYPEPEYAGPAPADAGDSGEEPVEEQAGEDLTEDSALESALEALLLVVDAPVDEASLASALGQDAGRVRTTLNRMSGEYTADGRGIDLRRAGEGWRFYTRDRYAPYVERMLLDGQRARLTRAALETLAVVAYRQPVTRARVSAVRGVNCDGVLRTLLTRGLVEEAGVEEQTQGTLFRTTELFLERLGLSSVQELPPLAPLLPDIDAIDDV
jgi:segregation and condensation protein B